MAKKGTADFLSHENTESGQAISGGVGMQPDIDHSLG